jgi:hypothetical protein
VLADYNIEFSGYRLIKITGNNTGLPGSRTLSADSNTGFYDWNINGSTGLPVLRLLKRRTQVATSGFLNILIIITVNKNIV